MRTSVQTRAGFGGYSAPDGIRSQDLYHRNHQEGRRLASDLSPAAAMQESRAGARFQTVALQPRHQLTRQVPVIVGWALFIAMVVLVLAAVFVIS